ncbi:MAG: hypothetical protein OSJ64_02825, partial [Firmicutes bacterium]|nr:hypothetical protein [Bacillota bacterium]
AGLQALLKQFSGVVYYLGFNFLFNLLFFFNFIDIKPPPDLSLKSNRKLYIYLKQKTGQSVICITNYPVI